MRSAGWACDKDGKKVKQRSDGPETKCEMKSLGGKTVMTPEERAALTRSPDFVAPTCCKFTDGDATGVMRWLTVPAEISACKFGDYKDGSSVDVSGKTKATCKTAAIEVPATTQDPAPVCCMYKEVAESAFVAFKWLTEKEDILACKAGSYKDQSFVDDVKAKTTCVASEESLEFHDPAFPGTSPAKALNGAVCCSFSVDGVETLAWLTSASAVNECENGKYKSKSKLVQKGQELCLSPASFLQTTSSVSGGCSPEPAADGAVPKGAKFTQIRKLWLQMKDGQANIFDSLEEADPAGKCPAECFFEIQVVGKPSKMLTSCKDHNNEGDVSTLINLTDAARTRRFLYLCIIHNIRKAAQLTPSP
jgi:hypothetical protein